MFFFELILKIVTSAGVFLGFIMVLYFLQKLACGLAQRNMGGKSIYLSAIIGTPIHEIAHFLMCIPFGHKVTEVALFRPDGNGTLGFVCHAYNPMSFWQQIGNFFIGIAPLLGGTAAIYLLTAMLLPNHQQIQSVLQSSTESYQTVLGVTSFLLALSVGVKNLIAELYNSAEASPHAFTLWLYLTGSISLHLSPSPDDMKGSLKGLVLILLTVAALQVVFYGVSEKLFFNLDAILITLSVSYTLCIVLAAAMALLIFSISLVINFFKR